MEAFVQDQIFGVVKTGTYAVNFQRGDLPHGHIPLFLDTNAHRPTPSRINGRTAFVFC